MGLCWSSPPVVEQEVELPDLENQLSAPKPRPTAATSWTHKPAILIPATLVCLILSGFALSIFVGYNSMSEPAQTGGANLPSEQVYLPTSLTLKNQTPPHANTIPPTFDNAPPTGLHSQATEHENADTNSESELQVDRPTSVIPDSQTSPIPPSAGHQTQEIDQQTYDTDLTSNLAIPGSSPISIPSGNTTPIDPQPLNSGFVSKSPTPNTFGEEHQDTSSMKVKRGDSVDLSSDHPVNPDLDKPNFSMTPAPHNTSGKTNPIIPEPVESDDSQIQAPPNPISGTPGNSNSAKSAAKPLDTPPIEDQAKPIETAQTGGANLPSEQVYLPNSLNLKNKTPSDANTIPPPFDNTIATGLQSQATDHQNADTNPESEPQVDESQTSDNTPSSDHQSQEIEHENADTAQISKLMIINPQTSTGSNTVPPPSDDAPPTGPQSPAIGHQNSDTNSEFEPQVDEYQTSENTPSSDHQSQEIEHENADTAQMSKLMILNPQTSTGSKTIPRPSDSITPTDPEQHKSGFVPIPNTPVKVKPEHVDLGSQTKTPLTSISSAPGNSSFKTNEDKIVPIQSDNTPIIKTSPESEPTPLTDLIRVPSAPKPAIEDQTIPIVKVEDQAKPIESIQTGGANLPSGQVYHPTSLTLKNNQTPPDANTIPPSFDNAFPTGPRSPATELQNADTNPESEPQVDESQTSDNTPSSDHQSQETELLKADAAQMPNLMILNPQTSPGSKTDNITPTGPQPPKSGFVSNSPTPNTSDDNAQDTPMNVKPVDVDPPSDHPVTPEKSVGPEDQQSSEDISGPPGYSPAPKNSLNSATNNLTEPNGPAILEESASFENEQQFFDVIISELSSDDGTKGPPENPSTSEETISSELSGVIRSTPDNSPASEQTKDASEQTKGTPPNKSDTKLSQSDDIPIVKPPSTLSVQSLSGSMNSNSPANVLTQTTSHDPPQEIVD
eukprot:116815_1